MRVVLHGCKLHGGFEVAAASGVTLVTGVSIG